jgi:hypothetical protein
MAFDIRWRMITLPAVRPLLSGTEWGLTVIIQLEAQTFYSGEIIFRMDLALVIPSGPPYRAKMGKRQRKKGKKNCHLPGSNKRPHEFEQMTSVVRSPN